ncbi:MAG TPA: hypothetical protein DEB40_05410 [Elusimicrobia bacterium]|nr:hypothetical protein [Elusimicrobiota bacterium]HBT61162.1 hypothetical protein [Elusimicrobiota bacterium]
MQYTTVSGLDNDAPTASVVEPASEPGQFNITQGLVLKASASLVLSAAGLYILIQGKKNQSLQRMLLGAALIMLSLLLF